jgi:hypothetical protein
MAGRGLIEASRIEFLVVAVRAEKPSGISGALAT